MSLQALYGCIECLHHMQGYLTIRDANSLHSTCKYLRNQLINQYYKEMLHTKPGATSIRVHGVSAPEVSYMLPFINSLGCHDGVLAAGTNCRNQSHYKVLFIEIFKNFLSPDKLINLSNEIYSVSSVDRAEERPLNCLKVSRCYLSFTSQMKILASRWSDTEAIDTIKYQLGIDSSRLCGCITQNPCYWSSKPSPTDDAVEHITFTMRPKVSVVVGFSITPYQAFFHPLAPTYCPSKVQLQFLRIKNSLVIHNVKVGGYADTDAELECIMSTEAFCVPNKFDEFVILFHQPIILTSDIFVRILMIGSQQRQTIQEANDDYYMCVSNFKLFGYDASSLGGGAQNERQRPLSEMDSDLYRNLVHLLGFKVVNMVNL